MKKGGLFWKPVGWVDTMGEKMGRLLPTSNKKAQPSFPSPKRKPSLVSDMQKSFSPAAAEEEEEEEEEAAAAAEDSEVQIKEQGKRASKPLKERDSSSGFKGPDTSSLSAFLYNLLSCNETGAQDGDKKASPSGGEYVMLPNRGPIAVASSSETLSCDSRSKETEGRPGESEEEEVRNHSGDFYDADWLVVDEHVRASSRQQVDTASPCQGRLPGMSDKSCLLSDSLRSFLPPALPTLARGRQWVLLYSTEKHGMSLLTLYRNSKMLTGPCLLVAGDRQGAVFGGLTMAPLVPTPKKKYQGTSESFVFTNVAGQPEIFHPTGLNRYYVLATHDALAFGGGNHFALHLDAELLNGSSGPCETYGSCCLAHSEEFVLKHVELWGFAHVSKDTPQYSSFEDPEVAPAFNQW